MNIKVKIAISLVHEYSKRFDRKDHDLWCGVQLGATGALAIYNELGSVHVIADTFGYFAPA